MKIRRGGCWSNMSSSTSKTCKKKPAEHFQMTLWISNDNCVRPQFWESWVLQWATCPKPALDWSNCFDKGMSMSHTPYVFWQRFLTRVHHCNWSKNGKRYLCGLVDKHTWYGYSDTYHDLLCFTAGIRNSLSLLNARFYLKLWGDPKKWHHDARSDFTR